MNGNRAYLQSCTKCLQNSLTELCPLQAPNFGKPGLGPKESEKNARQFTEEQLNAGKSTIGLQMGSNKGANQSGINFGNTRHM